MTGDFTQSNLDAALLDQKVAGLMGNKRYAYTTVVAGEDGAEQWTLGVVVQDEPGYSPITGLNIGSLVQAQTWADGLNKHIGLVPQDVVEIVSSSMCRSKRVDLTKWK